MGHCSDDVITVSQSAVVSRERDDGILIRWSELVVQRIKLLSKKKERGYAICAAGIVIFTIRLPESYSLKFVPESCA